MEDEHSEKMRVRNDSLKSSDRDNKTRETDELQVVGNILVRQKLNASSSSCEVDFVRLCEDIVEEMDEVLKRGGLLNEGLCKVLARTLSVKIACIREVVESCGRFKPAFVPLLAALYRYYERAEVLVKQCGEEDWYAAAIFQLENAASFTDIVRHINSVDINIFECAKKFSAVSITRQSAVPLDVIESYVGDYDAVVLRRRLEDVASERSSSSFGIFGLVVPKRAASKQISQYVLNSDTFLSQFGSRYVSALLKAIEVFYWQKENEPAWTWGDFNYYQAKLVQAGSGVSGDLKFLGADHGVGSSFDLNSIEVDLAIASSTRSGACKSTSGVCKTSWLSATCKEVGWVPRTKKFYGFHGSYETFLKEVKILAELKKHPCIVNIICCGIYNKDGDQFIAVECMEKSLFDLIKEQKGVYFSLDVALDIIWQIANGVWFLHEHGVAHCVLKPQNVGVTKLKSLYHKDYYHVKLVNFVTPKIKMEDMKYLGVGATRYSAPEVHQSIFQGGFNEVNWFKADAYSFAMTCVHVLTLMTPFEDLELSSEMYSEISNGFRPILPRACPKELVDLVEECWSTNRSERPEFSTIYKRLEKIIFNNMQVPFSSLENLMVPSMNASVGMYDTKEEEQDLSKEEGHTNCFTTQKYPFDEEVLTKRDSKIDESGLRNLIGDNLVIDLSSDLLSVTPSGYVIRTSFTDGHGVSQPCVLKRCDVVDQNPPDLARLQHPHVVHLIGFWIEEKYRYLFLVMEALDGDLAMLIPWTKSATPISLHVAVDLMLQIANGILYFHEMGVSYPRECDNVLYKLTDRNKTEDFRVGDLVIKLGGFGCSRPPHLESESLDALYFGLTCLEILTGNKRSAKLSIPETTPPILKDVIVSCLETRPTFSKIVEDLGRAQSEILRTYKSDDFIVSSQNMEPDIVQTKTDCGPEEESLIQQNFAVHQLHQKLGDTPTSVCATLIFFHGFRKVPEEWRRTWMTRDNKLVWPQKWLPEDLGAENIRVLSVSFDENPTVSNNWNRHEIGENLVQSLVLSPEWKLGESGEAIFLIGHSFGGVLIKYLVTKTRHLVQHNIGKQKAWKCAKFLERLAKIVFYSVPHASTGQEFENYASKCKKITPLKRSSFLQSLEGDTHFVADMNKLSADFESALPEKLQILAFLEGKAMSKGCILVTVNAYGRASNSWEWHKIDEDNHFEVCRPNSKYHTGYRILLQHLQQHLNDPYGATSTLYTCFRFHTCAWEASE